jgi:integrase
MAATEGIRSSFSTQAALHSPKLRIYEYLFLLNQKLQETVQILRQLEKCPWLRRDFLRSFQIEVEDLRAQTNFEVLEHMSDREQHDWAHFGKLRREWDRQFEDPDDVYLGAEQREKERGKHGLPPRLGIIPHEAIAAEETRLKAEQRRKKKRSRKAGR